MRQICSYHRVCTRIPESYRVNVRVKCPCIFSKCSIYPPTGFVRRCKCCFGKRASENMTKCLRG